MELRDYLKLISKRWLIFVIVIILCTLATYLYTNTKPNSYTATVDITVNKNNGLKQSQVNYYLFDNYYALQSASLFSQTVLTWFTTSGIVQEMYHNAGLNVPSGDLSKVFSATWTQPASVKVSTSGTDQGELTKLINSVGPTIQKEADAQGKSTDTKYEISDPNPTVTQDARNLKLNTALGFASGVILGVLVVLSLAYFKNEKA